MKNIFKKESVQTKDEHGLFSLPRMKMRRHRVFLLCTVGLCVISFLHYYKALHYVSLLRELSAPYPNIKSFIMVTGFFWRENGLASTPLTPASPEEAPPRPVLREPDSQAGAVGGSAGDGAETGMRLGSRDVAGEDAANAGSARLEMEFMEELEPPRPWDKPKENQQGKTPKEVRFCRLIANRFPTFIYHEQTNRYFALPFKVMTFVL